MHATQREGRLIGHQHQQLKVIFGEAPGFFIDDLSHPDNLPGDGLNGDAENMLGGVAGLLIDGLIKARVFVGVGDDDALTGGKNMARDSGGVEDTDLAMEVADQHPGVELSGDGVIEKECASLCVDLLHNDLKKGFERFVTGFAGGHLLRDV